MIDIAMVALIALGFIAVELYARLCRVLIGRGDKWAGPHR